LLAKHTASTVTAVVEVLVYAMELLIFTRLRLAAAVVTR
jgi:hypothetical protein